MNVYDFDGTIYRGDSSVDFYVYCILRYPWLICFLPYQIWGILLYKIGLTSKEREKSAFFSFLKLIPDVEGIVAKFWRRNTGRIAVWYQCQKNESDVVISASPEFLLRPACSMLGLQNLIASEVNPSNGDFLGKNCYGGEKVRRFREMFPKAKIDSFYSDSRSDSPMAAIAGKAYLVKDASHIDNW